MCLQEQQRQTNDGFSLWWHVFFSFKTFSNFDELSKKRHPFDFASRVSSRAYVASKTKIDPQHETLNMNMRGLRSVWSVRTLIVPTY